MVATRAGMRSGLAFRAPQAKSLMTTIELLELIQSALMTDAAVTLEDTRASVPDWDSVGHLSVISSLEASLGANAIGQEIQQAASVRQIADALQKAGLLKD
jgi:acyl carrier protein